MLKLDSTGLRIDMSYFEPKKIEKTGKDVDKYQPWEEDILKIARDDLAKVLLVLERSTLLRAIEIAGARGFAEDEALQTRLVDAVVALSDLLGMLQDGGRRNG